jgi:hypothetical protein
MLYIKPTGINTQVVGESNYQKNIKEVTLYDIMVDNDDMDYKDENLTATLILEDENQFDPGNAVRVDIDNKTVGYLDKKDASQFRKALAAQNINSKNFTCNAAAYGKRDAPGKIMKFGIWLNISLDNVELTIPPEPKKSNAPMLIILAIGLFLLCYMIVFTK